jgi:hypothetical protein
MLTYLVGLGQGLIRVTIDMENKTSILSNRVELLSWVEYEELLLTKEILLII